MNCPGCQGSGVKISIRQLGPSMIQQMQHTCNDCKGTGETINDRDRCPQCKGEKVVQEKKVLEVHVEKGMQSRQKITFPGEADEAVCIWSFELPILLPFLDICMLNPLLFFKKNCIFTARHRHRRYRIYPTAEGALEIQAKG